MKRTNAKTAAAAQSVRTQAAKRRRNKNKMPASQARGNAKRQANTRARQVGGVLSNMPDEMIERVLLNTDRATIMRLCRTNHFYAQFCRSTTFWLRWAEHYHHIPSSHLRAPRTANKQTLHRDIDAYLYSRQVLRTGWLAWLRAIRGNAARRHPSPTFVAALTLVISARERYVLEYDAAVAPHPLVLLMYSGDQVREWTLPHRYLDPGTLRNPYPAMFQYRDMVDFLTDAGRTNPPIPHLHLLRFKQSAVSVHKRG